MKGKNSPTDLKPDERWKFRTKTLMAGPLAHQAAIPRFCRYCRKRKREDAESVAVSTLRGTIEYAPTWVLVAVAIALGAGTTVGWKRIVVTVGEKIGKTHLTYSQGLRPSWWP